MQIQPQTPVGQCQAGLPYPSAGGTPPPAQGSHPADLAERGVSQQGMGAATAQPGSTQEVLDRAGTGDRHRLLNGCSGRFRTRSTVTGLGFLAIGAGAAAITTAALGCGAGAPLDGTFFCQEKPVDRYKRLSNGSYIYAGTAISNPMKERIGLFVGGGYYGFGGALHGRDAVAATSHSIKQRGTWR